MNRHIALERPDATVTIDLLFPEMDGRVTVTANPHKRTVEITSRICKPDTSDQWEEVDFLHTDTLPDLEPGLQEKLTEEWNRIFRGLIPLPAIYTGHHRLLARLQTLTEGGAAV